MSTVPSIPPYASDEEIAREAADKILSFPHVPFVDDLVDIVQSAAQRIADRRGKEQQEVLAIIAEGLNRDARTHPTPRYSWLLEVLLTDEERHKVVDAADAAALRAKQEEPKS